MGTGPTDKPAELIHLVLSGLADGTDLDHIAPQVAALASERSLFPRRRAHHPRRRHHRGMECYRPYLVGRP